MCGIVAYTGQDQAAPFLLKGLATLEYRGYDSAGVEVMGADGALHGVKCAGKVKVLVDRCRTANLVGTCGIAHWDETELSKPDHARFARQMTREVSAACEGAFAAGAEAAWVGTVVIDTGSDVLPPDALRFGEDAHGLSRAQMRKLRFNGCAVHLTSAGYVTDSPTGLTIVIE